MIRMTDESDGVTDLDRLNEEREELEEKETTLLSHDNGGGLPADDQNRLERVRERWADVDQEIQDDQDKAGPFEQ
jgi:hypothetical protein